MKSYRWFVWRSITRDVWVACRFEFGLYPEAETRREFPTWADAYAYAYAMARA